MKDEDHIILIIDDNPTNLNVLFEYLEESDFEVAVAQSGEHALEQLQHVQPDLILLDVMMPGIDGFETCRRLKKIEAVKDIPVIFMSALADEIDKVKGFLAGGADYITKPFHYEEILVRINAHLSIRKLQQRVQVQDALLKEQTVLIAQKDEQLQQLHTYNEISFSCVSHELQAPLHALLGLARLIDENLKNYSQEEIRSHVGKLRTSAEKLSTSHENLRLWSNIQRDALEFQPQAISLDEIAAYNILLFTLYARQKKITLSSSVQENTFGYADYSMINAVIRNLISSSLEFSANGEKVNISARHDDDHVVVSVSATDISMSKEQLPDLFQIDALSQPNAHSEEGRTSLGFLLCKELIKKNRGRIWAESDAGAGVTFRFTLLRQSGEKK